MNNPKFPLYIPSKGRHDSRLTSKWFDKIGLYYRLVVEPDEYDLYAKEVDEDKLLVLDMSYKDKYDYCDKHGTDIPTGSGPARNFIWDHSISEGHDYHWIMDDNIRSFRRLHQNEKIKINNASHFIAMEDFILRYKNIAMAGPHYTFFRTARAKSPPFRLNSRVYSCNLIRNDLPFRWRGRYNEDTILSIDLLKAGWCTILFNAFLQEKITTQLMRGGNTDTIYVNGTLDKSQMLVNLHPDVAELKWRYGRWHHEVNYKKFTTKLVRKDDYVPKKGVNNFGMNFVVKKNETLDFNIKIEDFIESCTKYIDVDKKKLRDEIDVSIKQFRKQEKDIGELGRLEKIWYDSLNDQIDYSVYADDFYFAEVWKCWILYSRKYLKDIQKPNSLFDISIYKDMSNVNSVLDLGCGMGYTTAFLKKLFSDANVIGTNLENTLQFKLASQLGSTYDFEIMENLPDNDMDLIFASEYFEHIERPIEHLKEVLEKNKPTHLLIANTFNQPAIGHFINYKNGNDVLNGKETSKVFNETLKNYGYKKIKTKLWNQRPNYWKLQ